MRNKVINLVENFYMCVVMSIKFWWLILRNFIICGLVAGIHGAMSYFASPKEEKDLHQKINSDVHYKLSYASILSAAAAFLTSLNCLVAIAIKFNSNNVLLIVSFWILFSWLILLLTFITELSLVCVKYNFNNDQKYYLRSIVLFIRCPQLTLTTIVCWLITGILIIKQPIIGIFIMPGVIMAIINSLYQKMESQQLLPN